MFLGCCTRDTRESVCQQVVRAYGVPPEFDCAFIHHWLYKTRPFARSVMVNAVP